VSGWNVLAGAKNQVPRRRSEANQLLLLRGTRPYFTQRCERRTQRATDHEPGAIDGVQGSLLHFGQVELWHRSLVQLTQALPPLRMEEATHPARFAGEAGRVIQRSTEQLEGTLKRFRFSQQKTEQFGGLGEERPPGKEAQGRWRLLASGGPPSDENVGCGFQEV
jgi:hypothetical protein